MYVPLANTRGCFQCSVPNRYMYVVHNMYVGAINECDITMIARKTIQDSFANQRYFHRPTVNHLRRSTLFDCEVEASLFCLLCWSVVDLLRY